MTDNIRIKSQLKKKSSTLPQETFSGAVCYLMTLSTADCIVSVID